MPCSCRPEEEGDFRETENVIREAFWDVYKPGCDEHLIAHKLRASQAFVPELDYVACEGARLVGNIMYSRARVIDERGDSEEVLCLGPIAVLPERQGSGIGAALMAETLLRARELGFRGVFLYGNPGYYARFGFVDARRFTVQTSAGENADYFMGLELRGGSLAGISGRFHEDSVFMVGEDELEDFERGFPAREKHRTPTQLQQG